MRRLALALILSLVPATLAAQAPNLDSLRTELVRSRGFIRAAETQLSKSLAILDAAAEEGPPVVLDWRTGEWELLAGGFTGVLNLDASTATTQGVTAPVAITFEEDTLRAELAVPGYAQGLLELVHVEGRLIGTVAYSGESRPASGQRPALRVVQVTSEGDCTFAQYTDGSWGVAPNVGACHQALDARVGPLRYVARAYVPEG